jgi:hypothetical protein
MLLLHLQEAITLHSRGLTLSLMKKIPMIRYIFCSSNSDLGIAFLMCVLL